MPNFQFSIFNFQKIFHKVLLVSLLFSVVSFVFSVSTASAADGIRKTINFQGKLVDENGLNVADGSYTVVFTLYNDPDAGANLWDETQTVTTVDGIFQVELGSVDTTLGNVNFNSDLLFLGIKVDADDEMTPRIRFTAVPYAFNAQKVNGLNVTNESGNPFSSATTLQIGNGKTVQISNGLTLAGTDGTTITFQGSDTYVGRDTTDILKNKTIGDTGLTFSGAATDITTASNEDLTFLINGSGDLVMNSDFDSGVSIGSASNTPAPLSVSGGIGNNAALIVNQTNSGDLFVASQAGNTKFRVANNGDVVLSAGISLGVAGVGTGSQCLLGGATASWGTCGSTVGDYWRLSDGLLSNSNLTTDIAFGGSSSESAKLKVSMSGTLPTASVSANTSYAGMVVDNNGLGDLFAASSSGLNRFVIKQNGNIGIGSSNPSYPVSISSAAPDVANGRILDVDGNLTSTTNDQSGFKISPAIVPGSNTNRTYSGGVFSVSGNSATRLTNAAFRGFDAQASFSGDTGTLGTAMGGRYVIYNTGAGTISNAYGILLDTPTNAGTLTNTRGVYIKTQTVGTQTTTPYGIYQEGATDLNYFAGKTGVGTTSPLAMLDVRGISGTTPIASLSGETSFATFIADQSGSGDIFTASKSGATKFVIQNDGTLKLDAANYANCGTLTTSANALVTCGMNGVGAYGDELLTVYSITAPSGTNLTLDFAGAANSAPSSASGTITFPSNASKFIVEVRGAGGGGGGTGGATAIKNAGGGGEGGFTREYISSLSSTYYLKVGGGGAGGLAGGINAGAKGTDTCFGTNASDACVGAILSATGGSGGAGVNSAVSATGGVGGTASGGDYTNPGQAGFSSGAVATANFSGPGGGLGGGRAVTVSGADGYPGVNGGGGSGAGGISSSGTTRNGGRGGDGYILIYVYRAGSGSLSWNQFGSGVLAPDNLATDVLIGGNATSSAKFGFLNVSGNTPTASISAGLTGALYMTAAGVIQTTANQALSLGGDTTGDVLINRDGNNYLGIGTDEPVYPVSVFATAPNIDNGRIMDIDGYLSSTTFDQFGLRVHPEITPTADTSRAYAGGVFSATASHTTRLTNATIRGFDSQVSFTGAAGTLGTAMGGRYRVLNTGSGTITNAYGIFVDAPLNTGIITNTRGLYIGSLVAGNQTTTPYGIYQEGITDRNYFAGNTGIGSGATTPFATLDVRGNSGTLPAASVSGQTAHAGLIVDNNGLGDLLTASKSGAKKFTVLNSGDLQLANYTTSGGFLYTNSSGTVLQTLSGGGGECLKSAGGGTPTWGPCGGGGVNYWELQSGLLYNGNLTTDFAIGGLSSTSAKFLVSPSGTRPTASVSANTASAGLIVDNAGAGDLLAASSSGLNRFVIKQNGNVGIGTSQPQTLLDIKGLDGLDAVITLDADRGDDPADSWFIESEAADNDLSFVNGTSEYLKLSSTGTVTFGAAGYGNCTALETSGGVLTCGSDDTTPTSNMNYLKLNNGTFSFINNTADILLGGDATGSAKFAFMNLNSNSGLDPLASFSGTLRLGAKNNSTVAQQTTWTKISQTTPGTIANGGTQNIASISASAVYNGSVYVGTYGTSAGNAEVYRYDGTNSSWTKVSGAAGTIGGNPTTNIASVSAMTVFDGRLYVGTSKIDDAEVYRYEGGTSWTKVSLATAGDFNGTVTAQDGVASMAVYNGRLYIGTREGAVANPDNTGAWVLRYEGGTLWRNITSVAGQAIATNVEGVHSYSPMVVAWGQLFIGASQAGDSDVIRYTGDSAVVSPFVSINTGAAASTFSINGAAGVSVDEITSMASFNGMLWVGIRRNNAADVLVANATIAQATSLDDWTRVNSAAGTMTNGGTQNIDQVPSMTVYNGQLYIGTTEGNSAEIYRYVGGDQRFFKVTQSAGQIAASDTSAIDGVVKLWVSNGDLYAGTMELGRAEVYKHTSSLDRSYGLEFIANPQIAGGIQNSNQNKASIFYLASASANLSSNDGTTGAFVFSHGIQTRTGSYDVAEDYPTRDDSVEAGDLMSIDSDERGFVRKSAGINDRAVIGVYSEKPALRLSQEDAHIDGARAIPVALAGRVPVKVSTESGEIKPGDYLTASSIPGVAMKATKSSSVIGQAMGPFNEEGVGKVLTYIKSASYLGSIASNFAGFTVTQETTGKELLSALGTQSVTNVASEIVTDTLVAGLRVVAPEITSTKLQVNRIEAVDGPDIDLVLDKEGSLAIKNDAGKAGITLASNGDASFAGTVQINGLNVVGTITAEALSVKKIVMTSEAWKQAFTDGGLVGLEARILAQESRIAQLESQVASGAASEQQASLPASLLVDMPGEEIPEADAKERTLGDDITVAGKLVADSVRVTGSAMIEGIVHVVDTLTVKHLIVDQLATFLGNVVFRGDVLFAGRPTFNNDTTGLAVIKKGSDRVVVTFEKPYDTAPMVSATITLAELSPVPNEAIENLLKRQEAQEKSIFNSNIRFLITKRTTKGFVIILDKPAEEAITFSWMAFASDDPVVHSDRGREKLSTADQEGKMPYPISSVAPTFIPTSSLHITTMPSLPPPEEQVESGLSSPPAGGFGEARKEVSNQ